MKSSYSSITGVVCALALTILGCLPAAAQTNGAGAAVSLNGTTNAWLNVPNGTWFSGNFTVEAWVNVGSYNSWSRLIDFSDGPGYYNVYLALTYGSKGYPTIGVFTNNDGSPILEATNEMLPTNQWVELAATGNGTNGIIYLNGTPIGTGMLNIAPSIVRTNDYIGRSAYSADSYADAIFDELRLWNVARTREQILTNMNHPLVGNESGLVGYWRFDEGSGTNAYDSTKNGNTVTLNSGVSWANSTAPITNAANYALNFNAASSEAVTIPHQATQNGYPFTVMCWFLEPTNGTGGGALVNKFVSSSSNGWMLAIGGQLEASYYRDTTDFVANVQAGAVNDGLWHHAAFVVDSGGGHLYLDGWLQQTVAWTGTAGASSTTNPVALGVYPGNSYFSGDIDEVSIWNVALSESQIQNYMSQPLQGTETGLVNYYQMNEGIGTNIYDYTTNADTGGLSPNPPVWILSGAQEPGLPRVVTLPATSTGGETILSGTVNPEGSNSISWFNWGLTTNYGNITGSNTFAGYFVSTNTATLSVTNGTYHFQIVAANANGTTFGADQSFQDFVSPQFQLGNSNVLEGPDAGTDSVVLGDSAFLSWTATANTSWLHLSTNYQSGSVSGIVIFSFDANPGPTRTGTLTIAGHTLTVMQAGSTYVQAGVLTTITNHPGGVAVVSGFSVDAAGDIYFNYENAYGVPSQNSVMEWTPTNNTISTIVAVSTNLNDYPLIGNFALGDNGNLFLEYLTETNDQIFSGIEEWTATNGALTTVVPNDRYGISSLALDDFGNVYFLAQTTSDSAVYLDEWIASENNVITLTPLNVGNGSVAVDAANNVYYSDYTNIDDELGSIFEWSPENGVTNLNIATGPNTMTALAVDGGGNVYGATITNSNPSGYDVEFVKWSPITHSQTIIWTSPILFLANAITVDSARNIYFGIVIYTNYLGLTLSTEIQELPYAFVDPTTKSESANAGSDALIVLPASVNLHPPFAPTSDQPWLTITNTANGVVRYSFTANDGAHSIAQPDDYH